MHFLLKDVTPRKKERTTIIAGITIRQHDLQKSVIQSNTHSTITNRSLEGMNKQIMYLCQVALTIRLLLLLI